MRHDEAIKPTREYFVLICKNWFYLLNIAVNVIEFNTFTFITADFRLVKRIDKIARLSDYLSKQFSKKMTKQIF